MNIIIFIIVLFILVVSHEFGHFIVAKKSGIRVDEFSFGFPPKLFGKKFGETMYNINLLPLGGYVKIFGENPDDESISGPDSKRSFINKPRYIQVFVLLAGVIMNFLVAWLLLSVGFMSGLPTSETSISNEKQLISEALTVVSVLPKGPAENSNLKIGDKILSLNSNTTNIESLTKESLQVYLKNSNGEEINFKIKRGKEYFNLKVTPKINEDNKTYMIGISMDMIGILKFPVDKAFLEGFNFSIDLVVSTFVGFYNLISNAIFGKVDMSTLVGPVGIVGVVGDAREFGFAYLLFFTALISINLAVLNLIPFPALDGGRILFLLIEKIKGSRIKPEIANMVNVIGFMLLMLLMLIITYHDVVKLL